MATAAATERLLSLDVFRGLTIAGMMIVNNQGGPETYVQLEHAEWHGWTYTDTIFPSFMWIVGVAMTLSTAKRVDRGDSKQTLLLHAIRRAALIFGIGLLLNGFPLFKLDGYRFPGVLQRIAVGYLATAVILLYTKMRGQILWTIGFLLSYWLLMFYYPIPGIGGGHFEKEANLERYVDLAVLGNHIYKPAKYWDPEGIVSTLPAIATVLFGALTAEILRRSHTHAERAARIFLSGNGLMLAGLMLSAWMPINKNLWTVSYAVLMAGISSVLFGACYWICDAKGYRKWSKPLEIYGMNAMAAYIAAGALARLLFVIKIGDVSLHRYIFQNWFAPVASPENASLYFSILFDLMIFAFAYVMYRRRWFLKL